MEIKHCLPALALTAILASADAKVELPPVLASNMVLQQQSDVRLRGKAKAGANLTVRTSWNGKTVRTKVNPDGTWELTVSTPEAGGPYQITLSDGDKLTLDNVLIGEVWFCSGQSNMEMPMRGFDRQPLAGGNDVIARAKPSTPVRMFITDNKNGAWLRQMSTKPQSECQGEWLTNTPENVANTSAAAYYFARYLEEVLEVPVGIIVSTLGGSQIEAWMSRESLEQFPEVDTSVVDNDREIKNIYSTPCVLYNAKLKPFQDYNVRGFLWYQGESNRGNYKLYRNLVPAFVSDIRKGWGNEEMPFYYVQIAPFDYEGPDGISAARLREVQTEHMTAIPHSGMVTTLDAGHHNFIHPINKEVVGQRLAWLALGDTYGRKGFGYKSPVYKSMEVKEGKVYINVENGGNGLCPMWTSLKGFEIAGADRVFHPAFAEIETKTCRLAVSSEEVPEPVAVRYGYHNYADAYVFNIEGLPLLPFRTDDWE